MKIEYKKYIEEYKTLSKQEITERIVKLGKTIYHVFYELRDALNIERYDAEVSVIMLRLFFANGNINNRQINLANKLLKEMGIYSEEVSFNKDYVETKFYLYDWDDTNLFQDIYVAYETLQIASLFAGFRIYKDYTNNRTAIDIGMEYTIALLSYNDFINESVTDQIDSLLLFLKESENEGSDETENEEEEYDDRITLYEGKCEQPDIINMGASIYKSDFGYVFSFGVEINVKDSDIRGLNICVQLFDKDDKIIETYYHCLGIVNKGIVYFGDEFEAPTNPTSYKVSISANEFTIEADRIESIYKLKSSKFIKTNYINTDDFASMIDSNDLNYDDTSIVVSVVFYDNSNEIIGGIKLDSAIIKAGVTGQCSGAVSNFFVRVTATSYKYSITIE